MLRFVNARNDKKKLNEIKKLYHGTDKKFKDGLWGTDARRGKKSGDRT